MQWVYLQFKGAFWMKYYGQFWQSCSILLMGALIGWWVIQDIHTELGNVLTCRETAVVCMLHFQKHLNFQALSICVLSVYSTIIPSLMCKFARVRVGVCGAVYWFTRHHLSHMKGEFYVYKLTDHILGGDQQNYKSNHNFIICKSYEELASWSWERQWGKWGAVIYWMIGKQNLVNSTWQMS